MFWVMAITLALTVALILAWPLLKMQALFRNYGFVLVFAIPFAALFLYQQVGTPSGIRVSGTPAPVNHAGQPASTDDSMDDLLARLEQRLLEQPDDLDGWLMLGRSYKTMQRYDKAEQALSLAAGLAPDDPLVMVELAEARLFASGRAEISEEIRQMLERAVSIDPNQQKALWLLGMAEVQAGADENALAYWERLIAQVEPDSPVAASVREQADLARQRLGLETERAWNGYRVTVSLSDPAYTAPPGAVLYLIASDPAAPAPPLGVRRVENPSFPLVIGLNDEHSMMQERPVSGVSPVRLLARLSMTGNPGAGAGDLESAAVNVSSESGETIALELAARQN